MFGAEKVVAERMRGYKKNIPPPGGSVDMPEQHIYNDRSLYGNGNSNISR